MAGYNAAAFEIDGPIGCRQLTAIGSAIGRCVAESSYFDIGGLFLFLFLFPFPLTFVFMLRQVMFLIAFWFMIQSCYRGFSFVMIQFRSVTLPFPTACFEQEYRCNARQTFWIEWKVNI